jgi:hypothetical protein
MPPTTSDMMSTGCTVIENEFETTFNNKTYAMLLYLNNFNKTTNTFNGMVEHKRSACHMQGGNCQQSRNYFFTGDH